MTHEAMRVAIAESEGLFKRKEDEIVEYQDWRGDFMFQRVRFPDGHVSPCHIENIKHYDRDLNAILPLLPSDTWIWRKENGNWCVERCVEAKESIGVIRNQNLALAACEFVLRWKGLWKE